MSKVKKGLFQGILRAAQEAGGQMYPHIAISPPRLGVFSFAKLKLGDSLLGTLCFSVCVSGHAKVF